MVVSLFFVGLQSSIFAQVEKTVPTSGAAQQLRDVKDTFLSALKSRKTAAIRVAVLTLIALLVVMAAKKGKFLPGATEEIAERPQDSQAEFVNLLNNYNGNPYRLVELLKWFISQKGGLKTTGIEEIGNSQIAQNSDNREVLRNFFLDPRNIDKNYASKNAAYKASEIFGKTYSFTMAIINANLPATDIGELD